MTDHDDVLEFPTTAERNRRELPTTRRKPTTLRVSDDLLEEAERHLVEDGPYPTISEALRDGLRVLLLLADDHGAVDADHAEIRRLLTKPPSELATGRPATSGRGGES